MPAQRDTQSAEWGGDEATTRGPLDGERIDFLDPADDSATDIRCSAGRTAAAKGPAAALFVRTWNRTGSDFFVVVIFRLQPKQRHNRLSCLRRVCVQRQPRSLLCDGGAVPKQSDLLSGHDHARTLSRAELLHVSFARPPGQSGFCCVVSSAASSTEIL